MSSELDNKTFLISRTDAIGDVVLTLYMCGWIKKHIAGARVVFLGKAYTQEVISSSQDVDAFLNWDEIKLLPLAQQSTFLKEKKIDIGVHVFPNREIAFLFKKAGIKTRIGTRNRWFHWLTCNHLVPLSRRHSPLHESQLNLKLLEPVGLKQLPRLNELIHYQVLSPVVPLSPEILSWFKPGKPSIILHPKSQGSGREWGLENFGALARLLHQRGFQVFISGTAKDGQVLQNWLKQHEAYITDITGKLSLQEFISFIRACAGLVAASTGPLHLAAGLGIHALGLFPPIRPLHPDRWGPIGPLGEFIVLEKACNACQNTPVSCVCIKQLSIEVVWDRIARWNLTATN